MPKGFWGRIHSYCYYNKMERNGIVALVVILSVFFGGLYFYESLQKPVLQTSRFFEQVDSIEQSLRIVQIKPTLFPFNPNLAGDSVLCKLGFSKKQIQNIQNYRTAGGHFHSKKDFKKLYFVTDSIFQIYEMYLVIPKKKKTNFFKKKFPQKKEQFAEKKQDTLFYFNPNTITVAEWEKLGVSKKVARTIKKYLAKGGHFKTVESLKVIYGLSEGECNRLSPYIQIPQEKQAEAIYELNTVTVMQLEKLKLRSGMAQRILKYRDLLGGYVNFKQLKEVYGIREFELRILQKHCKIESKVKQININEASLMELKKHPYINYKTAKAILRYRKRKGEFTRVDILREVRILPEKVFEKIKFYLKIKK